MIRERTAMLDNAWLVARVLVHGEREYLGDLEARFLKRKCCKDLPKDDCRAAFHTAVGIARTTGRFYQSRLFNPPHPHKSTKYQLLSTLAKLLERKHPNANPYLIFLACNYVEMYWTL